MSKLRLVAKKGSHAGKEIRKEAGILGYFKKPSVLPDAIINYGLAGSRLQDFYRRFPSAKRVPMINKSIGYSKLTACNRAEKNDIPVPETKTSLVRGDNLGEWIEKRTNSIGGIGIKKATKRGSIPGKYYQKFISNRRYELRVHAFAWIPSKDWRVQKRLGSADEIAWNYKNGGHFVTVKNPRASGTFVQAQEISEKVLKMLGMSFGAVDFLVDNSYNVYFIEINSAPGFSELSKPIYVDAFVRLKELSKKDVLKYAS